MSLKYRPEIDGLRAIAVLSVVIYHAEIALFGFENILPGGFIGVDIFFVISGFLITSIILRETQESRFSFADFYERRARRILPALFFVMLVSIPFAMTVLSSKALNEFGGSLLSSLFFSSNIFFWLEDSYWAEPSALKPFLHTWTLSVEEQFYIFFPVLILALWKFCKNFIFQILALLFIGSFILANYATARSPDASFFLLPFRGWELLAGSLLAKLELDHGRKFSEQSGRLFSALGLILIISAILLFHKNLPHPSYHTAVPILGVMLVIWFGGTKNLVTSFLSLKFMLWIGLISYALYLWHYPVFAFARVEFGNISNFFMLGLIAVSILLSIVSYFLVEKPLRQKTFPVKWFITLVTIVFVFLTAISLFFYTQKHSPALQGHLQNGASNGDSSIEPPKVLYEQCIDYIKPSKDAWCRKFGQGEASFVIWGDSHAAVYHHFTNSTPNSSFLLISQPGCPPIIGVRRYDGLSSAVNCSTFKQLNYQANYIKNSRPKAVILISRWTMFIKGYHRLDKLNAMHSFITDQEDNKSVLPGAKASAKTLEDGLKKTKKYFGDDIKIIAVEQTPDLQSFGHVIEKLDRSIPRVHVLEWHLEEREMLERLEANKHLQTISVHDLFCNEAECFLKDENGIPFYRDDNHMLYYGVKPVYNRIIGELEKQEIISND